MHRSFDVVAAIALSFAGCNARQAVESPSERAGAEENAEPSRPASSTESGVDSSFVTMRVDGPRSAPFEFPFSYPGERPAIPLSADGRRIGKYVRDDYAILDVATGETLARLDCCKETTPRSAVFAPGGEVIAIAAEKTGFWDVSTAKLTPWSFEANAIAVSEDGKTWAGLSSEGRVHLVDGAGRTQKVLAGSVPGADELPQITLSADGSRLLATSAETIELWDTAAGALLYSLSRDRSSPMKAKDVSWAGLESTGRPIVFTASRKHVLSDSGSWSLETLPLHAQHSAESETLVCSDGGQVCAIASEGGVWVRGVETPGYQVTTRGKRRVALTASGEWIAVDGQKTVGVWDVQAKQQASPKHEPRALGLSISGDTMVTSDGANVAVWTVGASSPTRLVPARGLSSPSLSADGNTVVSCKEWDLARLALDTGTIDIDDRVYFVDAGLSPKGTWAVVVLQSRRVALANVKTFEVEHVWMGPYLNVDGFSVSPDENRIAIAADGKLELWAIDGDKIAAVNQLGGTHEVAFSPDGRMVVSADSERVAVFNADDGVEQSTLANKLGVVQVAVLGTGRHLVTGGEDGSIRVFDITDGRELMASAEHAAPVREVSTDQDGTRVVSLDDDGVLLTWDFAPLLAEETP